MTRKQATLLDNYRRATATRLTDVYTRHSWKKEKAFQWCENKKAGLNGYDARICSASSHFFTYAFCYDAADGQHLCYETHANTYDFLIG